MKPVRLYVGIGICIAYILLFDLNFHNLRVFLDWLICPWESRYWIWLLYILSFSIAYVFISLLVLHSPKRFLAYLGVLNYKRIVFVDHRSAGWFRNQGQ